MRQRHIQNVEEKLKAFGFLKTKGAIPNSWQEAFGNDHPIYLEIGSGKGAFISQMAENYPDINFIGIERFDSIIYQACKKVADKKLNNVFMLEVDADDILEIFKENEISALFLNFSDPWPKNKHAKRRLTSNIYLEKYQKILNHEAYIQFKTDNRKLFEFSLCEMNNFGMKFDKVSLDLHSEEQFENFKTEYEEKFEDKGPIYYLKAFYQ